MSDIGRVGSVGQPELKQSLRPPEVKKMMLRRITPERSFRTMVIRAVAVTNSTKGS